MVQQDHLQSQVVDKKLIATARFHSAAEVGSHGFLYIQQTHTFSGLDSLCYFGYLLQGDEMQPRSHPSPIAREGPLTTSDADSYSYSN